VPQHPAILRRSTVVSMTCLSATTIYELEKKGQFPKPWLLTPRCAVWNAEEVMNWIASRRKAPAVPTSLPDQALRKSRPGRGKAKLVQQPWSI
jgi:prophage regulatory protein